MRRHGPWTCLALVIGLCCCGTEEGPLKPESTITLPDGPAAGCGPGNCNGCCSKAGACIIIPSSTYCGSGGKPCVSCDSDQVCFQGKCVKGSTSCSSSSCPKGCCKGDQCVAGTAAGACGAGGQPCKACSSTQTCKDHACACDSSSCSGCCDPATSSCKPGNEPGYCGKGGGQCKACKAGEGCVGGACKAGPSCGPSSCPAGCCDGSTCRPGTDSLACGTGGQNCIACQAGETCASGKCTPGGSCGPANCAGCCSGNQCQPGNTFQECGAGGGTCKTCSAGQACSSGVCGAAGKCSPTNCSGCCDGVTCDTGNTPQACGTGGDPCKACKAGQGCTSGICKLSMSSIWGVTVLSASISTAKSWDWPVYTEPDPFVELTVGSVTGKTTAKGNTYTPYWNELVLTTSAGSLTGYSMKVKVNDSDITGNELMGQCSVNVKESTLLSGYGWVSCGQYISKLYFKFSLK